MLEHGLGTDFHESSQLEEISVKIRVSSAFYKLVEAAKIRNPHQRFSSMRVSSNYLIDAPPRLGRRGE